jgi:hypothetical protein
LEGATRAENGQNWHFGGVLGALEGLKTGILAGKQEICMKTGGERAFIVFS